MVLRSPAVACDPASGGKWRNGKNYIAHLQVSNLHSREVGLAAMLYECARDVDWSPVGPRPGCQENGPVRRRVHRFTMRTPWKPERETRPAYVSSNFVPRASYRRVGVGAGVGRPNGEPVLSCSSLQSFRICKWPDLRQPSPAPREQLHTLGLLALAPAGATDHR